MFKFEIMKAVVTIIFNILFVTSSFAQTKQDYVYKYAPIAVSEMEIARVPASITLAQGLIESRYGTSQLSKRSNNHFGIKCHKNWAGGKVYHDDDRRGECFRSYNDPYLSFQDHSEFLNTRKRYSFLFQLDIKDYKGWAKGLKLAGYATDPSYANKLIRIIEEYKLYQFDSVSSAEVVHYVQQLKGGKNPVQYVSAPSNSIRTGKRASSGKKNDVTGGPAASPENGKPYSREEFFVNHIRTVHSFSGDSPQALAKKYKISESRLANYNEWGKYRSEFYYGMNVFLQPKRSKTRNIRVKVHKVKAKETMYQIAQHYGLKTSSLYALNQMDEEKKEQPRTGERIYLRKKRKTKPGLRSKNAVLVPNTKVSKSKKSNVIQSVKKKITDIKTPKVSLSKPKSKSNNSSRGTVEKSVKLKAEPKEQSVKKSVERQEVDVVNVSTKATKKIPEKSESKQDRTIEMPRVNNSKTGVVTIDTPDPFGQPVVHNNSTAQAPKRIQVPQSETPSVLKVVEKAPVIIEAEPTVQNQSIEQQPVQPISASATPRQVEYVYPNQDVKQVKSIKAIDDQKKEGRAIIYDSTPAINSTPVEVYKPEELEKAVQPKYERKNYSNAPSTGTKKTHKVVKGDTLYSLSRRYGVTVKQLQSWNRLSSSGIKIGQNLVVKP